MPRKLKRRTLDVIETLQSYEHRIRSLPLDDLEICNDSFLSSYDVFSTFLPEELEDYEDTRKFDERLDKPIFRLYSILREKGIRVLGITSERRMGDDFIAAIPFCGLRENVKILYVGQHNSFTKRKRNQTLSVLPIDKRYKENEGENLLND